MKQIVDKLNKIAKKIDESVEIPQTDLIIDSLDAITKAYGGTPNDSNLIVDKLEDIYNNIGSAPTGNIEITENTTEPLNIAQYATATVNVAGGGGLPKCTITFIDTDNQGGDIYSSGLLIKNNGVISLNVEGNSYSLTRNETVEFLYNIYNEIYSIFDPSLLTDYVITNTVNCEMDEDDILIPIDPTLDSSCTITYASGK